MKILSKIIKYLSYIAFFTVIGIIIFIYLYFLYRSRKVLNFEFIFLSPKGMILGNEGGIFPAIVGSIYFSLTAIIIAIIPALSCAIFLSLYADKKTKKIFHIILESISSIPSIVLGLFSYSLFVYKLSFGRCILSSAIALSIMVMPFMERKMEKAINETDKNYIITSYNLGINKYYMLKKLIIKIAIKEIVASILLALCFAMGALAPMIFTGAVAFSKVPDSIFKPSMALPMHLYLLISQGSTQIDRAYATAFVELMILLIFNIFAYILINIKREN